MLPGWYEMQKIRVILVKAMARHARSVSPAACGSIQTAHRRRIFCSLRSRKFAVLKRYCSAVFNPKAYKLPETQPGTAPPYHRRTLSRRDQALGRLVSGHAEGDRGGPLLRSGRHGALGTQSWASSPGLRSFWISLVLSAESEAWGFSAASSWNCLATCSVF